METSNHELELCTYIFKRPDQVSQKSKSRVNTTDGSALHHSYMQFRALRHYVVLHPTFTFIFPYQRHWSGCWAFGQRFLGPGWKEVSEVEESYVMCVTCVVMLPGTFTKQPTCVCHVESSAAKDQKVGNSAKLCKICQRQKRRNNSLLLQQSVCHACNKRLDQAQHTCTANERFFLLAGCGRIDSRFEAIKIG